jgi:hypothetical protein
MGPCPQGLDEAEVVVATHRQRMFGGEFRPTHFASDWRNCYRMTLDSESRAVQRFARKVIEHAEAT